MLVREEASCQVFYYPDSGTPKICEKSFVWQRRGKSAIGDGFGKLELD